MGTYDIFKKRYAKEQTVKPASSASKKTEKVETAKPETVEAEKPSSGMRSLDYFYNHTKAPEPVKANTLESLSASVTPAAGIVHGGRGRSFGMQRPVTAEASNEPARKQTVRPEFADQGISNSRGDTQILTGEPYNLTREGQWAAKHPIAGTLMYGVSNLVGGAEGFINTGEAALRALATGQKFNPNNIHAAPIAQGFRTGAAEGFRREAEESHPRISSALGIDSDDGRYTFGEKATDFLTGVGADAVSSGISMAAGGPLSTLLMGGSAANQSLYETSNDPNTTARQAAELALANGAAEAFFEHFSVERLLNFQNPTSTAQAVRAALAQAGVEASEEMFTEIANTLSDIAIRKDYSERGREYQDYIKQGMDPNAAAANTMRSAVTQIFLAGLGGALSGGLHTGAAMYGNTIANGMDLRRDLQSGMTLEDIAESIDTSTAEGQRVQDIANDIAQREASGTRASDTDLGYLSNAIANAAEVAERNEAVEGAAAPVEGAVEGTQDVVSETTERENTARQAATQAMNDVASETAKDTGEAFRNANYYNSQRMTAGERIFNAEMAEDMASTFGEEGQKAFSALPAEEGVKAYREWAAHYNNMRFGMPIREGMSTTLSPEQISAAMRAGALDANRAYPQDTMKAVNRAVNKISVNGVNAGNTDLSGIDYKSLTPQQRLRVDYTSTFVTKGLGMDVRYVKSEAVDGRYKGMNGSFQVINGRPTITLDVNAGMNRESDWTGDITDIKSMLPVISHETTHFLEQYNPKLYKELSNTVLTALQNNGAYSKGMTINSIIEAERQRLNDTIKDENGKPVQHTQDDAIHELVARACEDMLSGDKKALDAFNSLDANTKQTLWDHVKQVFDNIREFFAQMLSSYKSDSAEAKAIRQNMEEFEKIRDMWMNALDGSHAEDIGINIDTATESAAPTGPELSYRSWNASDWVQYKKEAAKELADALGVSTKTATKYINDVNSVAKMIFDDQVRLDYDSSEGRSAFVSNTEYGGSIDFSTLCKKRLLYTGTIQAIQNLLPNTALTPAEYLQIRQMMLDAGHEVTCGLCYVEGSRVKMGVYTKEFIEKYKKTNPEYVPTMAEMNTPDGQEKLRSEHPEVYDAYVYFMNHYGTLSKGEKALFASQQKPKLYTLRTEYKGEIKKKFGGAKNRASVADKNLNGGLRIQSFSDFEIVHMIDMMQVIMDMSEAGLAGQAYTKVPEFADSFGRTGLKINCSLITKGVDENGKLIFDDREGMKHERAFELRDKYSKNVGTVLVVFNQEQLRAALADDRIDYVLPFHKSQWTSEQYDAIGLPEGTIDFTNYQNDYIKGAKSKENVMPMEYWDFSKSGRENAERYLQICAEEGRTPKFARIRGENLLIDNGDGTWSLPDGPLGDGYFKLLIDFKMYDNNGKGARQMPVRPNFSMDEIRTALNDYKGGHRSFPVANDIVQEFVDNYKEQNPRAEYSTREASGIDALDNDSIYLNARVTMRDNSWELYDMGDNYELVGPRGEDFTFEDVRDAVATYSEKTGDKEVYTRLDALAEFQKSMKKKSKVIQSKADTTKDSTGRTVPKAMLDYMKNSKMRDSKGQLIPMYHGTGSADFTIFDPNESDDKTSLFFTDNPYVAETYLYGDPYGLTIDTPIEDEDYVDAFVNLVSDATDGEWEVSEDGLTLTDDNGETHTFKTVEESREYFRRNASDVSGVYAVYLNLENPLIVKANGAEWNNISAMGDAGGDTRAAKLYQYLQFVDYGEDGYQYDGQLNGEDIFGEGLTIKQIEKRFGKSIADDVRDGVLDFDNVAVGKNGRYVPNTTREYAEYAKKHGYDGVIFRNLIDIGEYGDEQWPSTVAIAFNSDQVKSVHNESPTKNPDIRYSTRDTDYAPTFYSKLQREIQNFKGDKIGAASVESYLKGKGVKDEEIKWSGIRLFLEGKKSVNKAELMQYLKDNELQIEETVSSGTASWYDDLNATSFKDKEDAIAAIDDYLEYINEELTDDEKLTRDDLDIQITDDRVLVKNDYEIAIDARAKYEDTNWSEYKLNGGSNYREVLFSIPGSNYSNQAMQVHWKGKTGVLAHARVQDFEADDGGKVLFVEEIQSDWHNAGQKNGYIDTFGIERLEAEKNKAEKLYDSKGLPAIKKASEILKGKGLTQTRALVMAHARSDMPVDQMKSYGASFDLPDAYFSAIEDVRKYVLPYENAYDAYREASRIGTPDAPFRSTYTDYVLKNLLRMAAEEDYDYLAWTTSDMQMERWNPNRQSTAALTGTGASDDVAFEEGYRIEYDQQIPKFLKKYGKQWGAGLTDVSVAGNEVPAIVINDAMKDSVLHAGQPMFSQRNVDIDARIADLVEKYGAKPKGENPQRDDPLPEQTSAKKHLRRFARTVWESGITTDDIDEEIKKAIIDESLSYEVMTDKASAEYAASVLRIGGTDRAQREWDRARRSDTFNKDSMALGQFLLKEYAKNNDVENAMKMIQELAAEGTRMGQNIQAMRMLKKYAQQIPAVGLGYIQRTVDQMNRDAKRKMGKKYKAMKIDQKLADAYLNAKTKDEIDAAIANIYKDLGSQVQMTGPEAVMHGLRTWRYMAMLGNPRTHIRNLVGNALFVPAVTMKNAIGAGLESTMKTKTRTKSVHISKEAMDFAKQDAIVMRDTLSGRSDMSIRSLIEEQRKPFPNRLNALNKASEKNSQALEAEDWIFLRRHYENSLAQYITANRFDTSKENPAWLGKARNYAVLEAQKATYRDANKLSAWLNQSSKAGAVVRYMMEGLLPFKKTPANILRRGVEYSPAGLIATLGKGTYDLNHGNITVNEWIDGVSSGLTGTAIFGLGMFLASTGAILGGYDDDEDKELRKLKGLQEYSVRIGNKTYTIDWAAPGSLPLFVGVETMNALRSERGLTMDDMGESVIRMIDPMINMSMLSGLNDTLDAISYSDNKLSAAAMETFYSLLGQYVPTLFGQAARTIDTTQRINYQDKNKGMSKNMLYFIEKMQNKIPFLTFSNDPYLNEFGQENDSGPHWAAALQNFVSPGYISAVKDDKVINEIERLQGAQEENVLPNKMPKYLGTKKNRIDLTSAQYTLFQRTAGQTAYNILDRMIDDRRYDRLNADQQAAAIKMAYDYAKAVGRIAIQPEYESELKGDTKKIYNAVKERKQAFNAILDICAEKSEKKKSK